MTKDGDTVVLTVNGKDYAGWKSVSITAGLDRQARSFVLDVTRTWPGAAENVRQIQPLDRCELYIGQDLVMTGHVDATPIRYTGYDVTVGVIGRSLTADLVDCSAVNSPGQWRNVKVERIAQDLAAPYNVKVKTLVDTGDPIIDHQLEVGEKAFESLDRLLTMRQLMSTDDETGALVLIEPGLGRAHTALVFGQNVKDGEVALDFSQRFSAYVCKGQRAGDDDAWGESVSEQAATVTDTRVKRNRVLIIKQSGQADEGTCKDRVEYERAYRAARSVASTYLVQGWRQGNGQLWVPNLMVPVKDPVIGFDDELLISEVEYRLSGEGTVCRLNVCPLDGYMTPVSRKKKQKSAGNIWGDVK